MLAMASGSARSKALFRESALEFYRSVAHQLRLILNAWVTKAFESAERRAFQELSEVPCFGLRKLHGYPIALRVFVCWGFH